MKKKILYLLSALIVILIILGLVYADKIKRLNHVNHLFDEDVIVNNFQNMSENFATANIKASRNPKAIIIDTMDYELPKKFSYLGQELKVADFLKDTRTEGLMILKNGKKIYENYDLGLDASSQHISWSMAKSFVSTLMGIAYDKGLFQLNDKVDQYLPQFKGTAYEGVTIKNLLQMSTGVRFNEDYGDFNSDINKFGRAFAWGTSLEKFSKSLEKEGPQGTYCHYVSINTQVLGILVEKLTGKDLATLTQEQLWEPMGMEDDAYWITDDTGTAVALGGLNATLRDFAKLGLLYLYEGTYNGKQIVSKNWIKLATTPDAPHLVAGQRENSAHAHGYAYQWWIPSKDEGDFFAAGIYNQFIYVNPKNGIVVAKLSANHNFKTSGRSTQDQHVDFFKVVAESVEAIGFSRSLNVVF